MKKILGILILVAVLALGARFIIQKQKTTYNTGEITEGNKSVFPNLAIQDVDKITFTNRYGTLNFTKQGDGWVIPEKDHYPAYNGRINDMLIMLSELQTLQDATIEEKDWAKVGIQDPLHVRGEGSGARLDLYKGTSHLGGIIAGELQASNSDASMIFGAGHDGRSFIRKIDQKNIYLVNRPLDFIDTVVGNWIDGSLYNPYRYKEIRYHKEGNDVWTLTCDSKDSLFKLTSPDHSAAVELPNLTQSIHYGFSSMLVRDVMNKEAAKSDYGIKGDHYFELIGFDGEQRKLYLGNKVPASDQEKAVSKDQSGVFRSSAVLTYRCVTVETELGDKQTQQPQPGRIYYATSTKLDEMLLTYSELLTFEKMSATRSDEQ